MQDITVISETLTIAQKATINASGSLILNSGASLSMTSGANLAGTTTLVSGANLNAASGASMSLAAGANLVAPSIGLGAPGTASVSVATASGTTIPIAQGVVRASCTAATTSGSCTLATGTLDGQVVTIVNESANNLVITGNMKANQTLAASSGMQLVWVSADTLWWRLN